MKKLILLLLFISCNNQSDENNEPILNQQTVEVYLLNTLNDSRGYCIDMKGYKTDADINKSLQAHSCYSYQGEVSVDQGFDIAKITNEEFYIHHLRFVWKQSFWIIHPFKLNSCDKSNKQRFILQSDGKIQPKSDLNLCLTVSENFSEGGGGSPVHLIRTLYLEDCNDALSSYQKWGIRAN
jgi:hypothetical protein